MNRSQDGHRDAVGGPDPAGGDQPPERVGVLVGLDRPHELRAQPARRAEEVVQDQAPDGVRVEEHQAGQDPQDAQQGRVGRGEPERVPGPGQVRASSAGNEAGFSNRRMGTPPGARPRSSPGRSAARRRGPAPSSEADGSAGSGCTLRRAVLAADVLGHTTRARACRSSSSASVMCSVSMK